MNNEKKAKYSAMRNELENEYLDIVNRIGKNMFNLKRETIKQMVALAEEEAPYLLKQTDKLETEVRELKALESNLKKKLPSAIEMSIVFSMASGTGVREIASKYNMTIKSVKRVISVAESKVMKIYGI